MVSEDEFQKIIETIRNLFSGEELIIILLYVTRNFSATSQNRNTTQFTILSTLKNDAVAFSNYLLSLIKFDGVPERIIEDCRRIYDAMRLKSVQYSKENSPTEINMKAVLESCGVGIAYAFSHFNPETQRELVCTLPKLLNFNSCVDFTCLIQQTLDRFGILGRNTGPVLAMVYLTYEGLNAVYRWYKGEISGARCAKIIVDSLIMVGAGYGGAALGTYLASSTGPYGMVIGAVAGGATASVVAGVVANYCTCKLFNLPQSEAVESAYRYFGVQHDASTEQINNAFSKACIAKHPQSPGGSQKEYALVQSNMTLIKVARGEKFL